MSNEDHSWLEPVLRKELRGVEAPADLWQNIEQPRMPVPASGARLAWALGAAMVVAALLWGFHLRGDDARFPAQSWIPSQLDSKSCVLCHVGA